MAFPPSRPVLAALLFALTPLSSAGPQTRAPESPLPAATQSITTTARHPANPVALQFSLGSGESQSHVQAAAVTDAIFRISITPAPSSSPLDSIYLDPARPPESGGALTTQGDLQTLTTPLGQLRINPTTGQYSLVSASGATLIPPSPLLAAQQPQSTLALRLGWPTAKPFSVYGSGNPTAALAQTQVKATVGNGIAVEPFFWSPPSANAGGFAVFIVGDNANTPASCDGHITTEAGASAITLLSPGKSADLYLLIAPTLGDATRNLFSLTGRPPVPPLWAFGYLQSRWGWQDAAYIDDTLRHFRDHQLPVDAFIFDFEWYTSSPDYSLKPQGRPDFTDFGIQSKLFPNSADPFEKLKAARLKVIGIRKPRLGNSASLDFIHAQNWGLTPKDGQLMDQRAMNFVNPDLRRWYADHTAPLLAAGIDGWWNDEGEFTYTTYPYWNLAEREALDKVHPPSATQPAQRLWTINRAFCPGLSRFGAAAWTGDVKANWAALRRAPADLLNWSVAGMPYGSTDAGGFDGETNPELLTRWMQAATFFPNMRAHSTVIAKPHFPWLFGDDAEAAIKKTLQLRYALVPTLYSLAHLCHDTGTPLMRPLFLAFPNDPNSAEITDEWLLGDGLLAAPILTPGGKRSVYLPEGTWYTFATNEKLNGGQTLNLTATLDDLPAFVRAGTLLPLAKPAQRTADLTQNPLELHIYPGHDATFTLVEDDGQTDAYTHGAVRKTVFTWTESTHTLSWRQTGTLSTPTYSSLIILLPNHPPFPSQPLTPAGTLTLLSKDHQAN